MLMSSESQKLLPPPPPLAQQGAPSMSLTVNWPPYTPHWLWLGPWLGLGSSQSVALEVHFGGALVVPSG